MIPFFVIFVNSNLSTKLVNQIIEGSIHSYIYAPTPICQRLKKIFVKSKPNSFYRIIECNMAYHFTTFNFLLSSKSFWDNIPIKYERIFVLFNPRCLALTINFKSIIQSKIPFSLIPMKPCDIKKLMQENPSLIDEQIMLGFLFYIKNKFARQTIQRFTKNHILSVRKEHKMQNNEHIERLNITPFYLYFYHRMLNLGYNL